MLRALEIGKRAAGFHHAHDKKQHQQCKADGLQSAVDIYNDAPNGAALELLRTLGNELPDFGQLFIPGVQGVL